MNDYFDTVYQLEGTIAVVTTDLDDTPNKVLPINQAWKVEVDWHLLHQLPPGGNSPIAVGGSWFLTVSLESIGAGYEGPVQISGAADPTIFEVLYNDQNYLVSSTHNDFGWKAVIDITAAEMTRLMGLLVNPLIPNSYRVSVVITFKNTLGQTVPMVASNETNLVTFYLPD